MIKHGYANKIAFLASWRRFKFEGIKTITLMIYRQIERFRGIYDRLWRSIS